MTPTKAAGISLLISLIFGAVMYMAIGYVWVGDVEIVWSVFGVCYAIYMIIQLVLTSINLHQAESQQTEQNEVTKTQLLIRFIRAEAIFYFVVFGILAISAFSFVYMVNIEMRTTTDIIENMGIVMLVIGLCSLPYIFCCTFSVFLFHHLLTKDMDGKMEIEVSNELTIEATGGESVETI